MKWVVVTLVAVAILCPPAPPASGSIVSGPDEVLLYMFDIRDGSVKYARLAKDGWRAMLPGYMREVSRSDSLAFWINTYNVLTIDLIVREWRERRGKLKSIRDIGAAWSRPRWTVLGRTVSLDKIEHEILRGEFREPRTHFALVCASKSCPALRSIPFRGTFLDAQLDSAAREFVLDPSRNDFTPRGGAIRISKIFDWYGKDFVGVYSDPTFERLYGHETGAVLAYVSRFLPAETVAALRAKRARVTYLPYDWSLNIAPSTPSAPAAPRR